MLYAKDLLRASLVLAVVQRAEIALFSEKAPESKKENKKQE